MELPPIEVKKITYKEKIVFEKVTVPTFKRIPKLYNKNEACFMFVEKGTFLIRTPYQIINFDKENALLAKCFNYFAETTPEQRKKHRTIELIGVLLYPDIIKEIFPYPPNKLPSNRLNVNKVHLNKLLLNYKESINLLIENPDLADEELILNKLKEFIILVTKTLKSPSELEFLTQIFSPTQFEFRKTIEKNLYSNLSLEELARLCSMSLSTFNRTFKENYNTSPKKYINQKKIEKALSLLLNSSLRVSDIAYRSGFESISTFNRMFQKVYKKSPSKYVDDIK
ncbi:AraC family transcriptional regulator [uncultured Algibacter sp.]|uniref:helix-turn-helix domain-containing protein n=1 Tax=uncultured Algibacter sp. TaxID=298659 RepID=UPI002605C4DA|nr:AraC family transcriptional regulator [uncultured Algibacter sp.]